MDMDIKFNPISLDSDLYTKSNPKKPVHIESFHIPYIYKLLTNNIPVYISPKCDGIYTYITVKLNNNEIILESEYVNKLNNQVCDIYYIFDVIDSKNHISIQNRMIEKLFNIKMIYDIELNENYKDKIKEIITKEHKLTKNLYIKPLIKIIPTNEKIIRDFLSYLFDKPVTPYDNDGWILHISNNVTPLKLNHYLI